MYAKIPEGLPSLNTAFQDSTCRIRVTSMFVDQENSTKMQAQDPEGSWVPQTAFFYDLCDHLVREAQFPIHAKFLGDGIMLTADTEHATDMVNLAINLQEAMRRNGPRPDGSPGTVAFNVSIGIVTGTAIRFLSPDGLVDFVGKTISSARRLCDAATARAVFIDIETAGSIVPVRISSEIGRVQGRQYAEYLGEVNQTEAKGLTSPLQYYEILWESNRFGRKNELARPPVAAAAAASRRPSASIPARPPLKAVPSPTGRQERRSGRVKIWGREKGFGFIICDDGEEFYVNKALLAYDDDAAEMQAGVKVAFTVLPPTGEAKLRRAVVVLLEDKDAFGVVHTVPTAERPYGWIEVRDERGASHLVYCSADSLPAGVTKGDEVDFTVKVTPKGASAVDIQRSTDDSGDEPPSSRIVAA